MRERANFGHHHVSHTSSRVQGGTDAPFVPHSNLRTGRKQSSTSHDVSNGLYRTREHRSRSRSTNQHFCSGDRERVEFEQPWCVRRLVARARHTDPPSPNIFFYSDRNTHDMSDEWSRAQGTNFQQSWCILRFVPARNTDPALVSQARTSSIGERDRAKFKQPWCVRRYVACPRNTHPPFVLQTAVVSIGERERAKCE